jgi:hypothetical protein
VTVVWSGWNDGCAIRSASPQHAGRWRKRAFTLHARVTQMFGGGPIGINCRATGTRHPGYRQWNIRPPTCSDAAYHRMRGIMIGRGPLKSLALPRCQALLAGKPDHSPDAAERFRVALQHARSRSGFRATAARP